MLFPSDAPIYRTVRVDARTRRPLAVVAEGVTLEAAFELARTLNAAGDGHRYDFGTMPLARQGKAVPAKPAPEANAA